jgi:hypothetical protein
LSLVRGPVAKQLAAIYPKFAAAVFGLGTEAMAGVRQAG